MRVAFVGPLASSFADRVRAHLTLPCDFVHTDEKNATDVLSDVDVLVTLVFTSDGRVKDAKISDTYAENAVGKCVLRAMNSVIVPAYTGSEHTVEWEIDLTGAKKSGAVEKKE